MARPSRPFPPSPAGESRAGRRGFCERVRKPESQLLPLLAISVLAVIWGYNWIMMKVGVTYAPPFTFAALRALLGALMLFGVMALLRRSFAPRPLGALALIGLLQTTGFIGFSTWALAVAGAGKTVVLVYTMPFWIVLFGWPLLGERIRGLQWPAFVVGLTGLILLLNPKTGGSVAGDVLAILAGLTWGLASIVAKRLYRSHDTDLIALTAWQMLLGAIPLAIVALMLPAPPLVWSAPLIVALAYNVIPATALSWLLWMYALKRLPAATAGMALLANPLVGVIAAWLQLGERPGPIEIGGMVLIGLALLMIAGQALREDRTLVPAA
jgi:drug/metabolite transporter (DMT)-like permease